MSHAVGCPSENGCDCGYEVSLHAAAYTAARRGEALRALREDNDRLAAEVAEWERSFELYHGAIRRGTALWQQATGRDDVLPDVAKLVAWVLTEYTHHATDIAKLRRTLTCLTSEVRIFGNITGDLAEALISSEQILNETKEEFHVKP